MTLEVYVGDDQVGNRNPEVMLVHAGAWMGGYYLGEVSYSGKSLSDEGKIAYAKDLAQRLAELMKEHPQWAERDTHTKDLRFLNGTLKQRERVLKVSPISPEMYRAFITTFCERVI